MDAAGTGVLVGREGGGAGARRVGGFMWLLGLRHCREAVMYKDRSIQKGTGQRQRRNTSARKARNNTCWGMKYSQP